MKIELWYDAVAQETDILINGAPVEKNDIYGFLYPVRNYPIQSWIYPNGSWKGLEHHLVDLARDEAIELTFRGRRCDYEDLRRCFLENDRIALGFIEWDICSRYDALFSNLLSTLRSNDCLIRTLLSLLNMEVDYVVDFEQTAALSDWVYRIRDDADLDDADEKDCCNYYVYDDFFTCYEKLQVLLPLTRSLKIPADAIYCCFKDNRKKDDYAYYAQSFKRMNFRFCLENEDYSGDAESKYGIPFLVRKRIAFCGTLSETLCNAYGNVKNSTRKEFNKFTKNIVSLSSKEKERYQTIKKLRDSVDRLRYGMEFIYKYIDILFSVSKENKEEVFHHECIEKLDGYINLYLNAKSYSEVN